MSQRLELDVTYWLPDNPSETDGLHSVVATSEGNFFEQRKIELKKRFKTNSHKFKGLVCYY